VNSSEQALIDRWRHGDAAAFAGIIERHQRAVFGYLRARLTQSSDAEDMTQEVFLRFHLAQARFDSNSLIRPWLLGIARNLLREHIRGVRKRKEVAWTETCLELEAVLPFDPHATDDALMFLPECLDGLGPSARQAMELKYGGDQKLAAIGRELHRSEGAVKLLVHRARQALRDCLQQKTRGL
jgi:RNA polymerase sigma-70 factor (ECF subfamily)